MFDELYHHCGFVLVRSHHICSSRSVVFRVASALYVSAMDMKFGPLGNDVISSVM